MNRFQDSPEYRQKKAFFQQMLTVYGRKPVQEALQDPDINSFRLHLAHSNKTNQLITAITTLAQQRQIDIQYHDRQALARISKNGKQDQGVCLDIHCPQYQDYDDFIKSHRLGDQPLRLLALDRITNPQNLGMIIRAACAGTIDGILIPEKGCAKLDPLVIKASAGTLFKAPLLRCQSLGNALKAFKQAGYIVVGLSGSGTCELARFNEPRTLIYILGNETEGIQASTAALCDEQIFIKMHTGVESLNVAITAGLLAFRGSI